MTEDITDITEDAAVPEDGPGDDVVATAEADADAPNAPVDAPQDEAAGESEDDDEDEYEEVDTVNVWLVRALIALGVVVLFLVGLVLWRVAVPSRVPRSAAEQELFRMREEVRRAADKPDAHVDYANALYKTGDVDGAIAELQEALKLDKNHVLARYNLAIIYYYNGQKDKAIASLRELVKSAPTDAEGWYRLGVFLQEKGDTKGAQDAYGRAVELRPEDVTARVKYGDMLAAAGKKAEAKAQYQAALAYVPGYEPAETGLKGLTK